MFFPCFSEKLPAAGNLALYSEGKDKKDKNWTFLPQCGSGGGGDDM